MWGVDVFNSIQNMYCQPMANKKYRYRAVQYPIMNFWLGHQQNKQNLSYQIFNMKLFYRLKKAFRHEITRLCPALTHHRNPLQSICITSAKYMKKYFSMTWLRHQMEEFFALLALCAGNSPVPGEFPSKRPVTQRFDVFFDLCLNKRLSKQSRAGDLRSHPAHYYVIVMSVANNLSNNHKAVLLASYPSDANNAKIFYLSE